MDADSKGPIDAEILAEGLLEGEPFKLTCIGSQETDMMKRLLFYPIFLYLLPILKIQYKIGSEFESHPDQSLLLNTDIKAEQFLDK